MSAKAYVDLIIKEQRIHSVLGIIIPFACLLIIYLVYVFEKGENLPPYVYAFPPLYFVTIFIIYEKPFRKLYKSTSAEYFFTKLTFERAVIRYEHLEKFHRYSIIALIVSSVIVIYGVNYTVQDYNHTLKDYDDKQKKYDELVRDTYGLTEPQLREYFQKQINQMNTLQADRRIVTVFGNELIKQGKENVSFAEFHIPGNQILWNMTDDLEKRQLLEKKYNEMSYDELKTALSKQIASAKPDPFDIIRPTNTLPEFLFIVILTPAILVYVILPFKYSLTKIRDFYYLITKGCLRIICTYNIGQMTKRKYMLMALDYYSKFVKKNTGMSINNLDSIKSLCLSYDSERITRLANNMLNLLEDNNRLKLLIFLQNKIGNVDYSQNLIQITIFKRIKENWPIIASTLSFAAALLSGYVSYVTKAANP